LKISCRLIYFASYVTAKLKVNHYSNLINPTLHLLALRGIYFICSRMNQQIVRNPFPAGANWLQPAG